MKNKFLTQLKKFAKARKATMRECIQHRTKTFRYATIKDIPELTANMTDDNLHIVRRIEVFLKTLCPDGSRCDNVFLMLINDKIIGAASFDIHTDVWNVTDIHVILQGITIFSKYRKLGLFTIFINKIIEEIISRNKHATYHFITEQVDVPLIPIFEREGFNQLQCSVRSLMYTTRTILDIDITKLYPQLTDVSETIKHINTITDSSMDISIPETAHNKK